MRRKSWILPVAIAAGFMLFGAKAALADDCTALGGALNAALTECQINSAVVKWDEAHPGSFNIAETLRICGPVGACDVPGAGKITVPQNVPAPPANANPWRLTINVTGNFIMEDGSAIIGDRGNAPNDSTAIGATIAITTDGDIDLGVATISSRQTAGSCNSPGVGGNITLTATNGNITANTGSLIDTGSAVCPAGDIVITATPTGKIDLDGQVLAQGLISGTGKRAGGGRITVNAGCDLVISDTGVVSSRGKNQGADLVHLQGCKVDILGLVESVNVQGGGHADGVDNACNLDPVNHPNQGQANYFTGCVEIWSGTTITIDKLNSNGEVSVDGVVQNSSWIDLFANGDIKIIGDTAGNFAVHGNPTGATNNSAALITVKSKSGDVAASNRAIQANATGGGSSGGTIKIEAGAAVNLDTATLEAEGDFVQTGGFGFGGKISARSFSGSLSWQNGVGNAQPTGADTIPPIDVSAPTAARRGVITLFTCAANVPNTTGTTFPFLGNVDTNPVITNVGACGGEPDIPAALPPATCTEVCGGLPLFGECEKAAVKTVLNPVTGRFPGNLGPDVTIRLDLLGTPGNPASIQEVLDTVTDSAPPGNNDGYIIVQVNKDATGQLGGNRTESIVIDKAYDKRFALIGCSVTLHDANTGDNLPTALIADTASSPAGSPENIFVMDLHGSGSEVAGWKVVGDGRYMRNVYAKDNLAVGMWFLGNGNTMHNGQGTDNGEDGILVQGNLNLVADADAFGNDGNGVTVVGNGNTIEKVDTGDKNKGNGGDGLNVSGNSNVLEENTARANTLDGFRIVSGTGNTLKKNVSGGGADENNGDCEFEVVTGNTNLGENKANGVTVPGAVPGPFPTGCIGSP